MQWSRGWARHWDREFCGVPVQANGLKKKPVRCDFRCDAWVRIADMCFSWGFLSGTVSIACFVFGDASPQRGDVEIQLNHGSRAQEPLSDSSIYPGLKTYNPILNPHILSHLSQDALCIRSCQEVCPIKHGRARFYIYYIYIIPFSQDLSQHAMLLYQRQAHAWLVLTLSCLVLDYPQYC